MRRSFSSWSWVVLLCVAAELALVHNALGSHAFPDYPVRSASSYTNKVQVTGLIIAVEAVDDQDQQKLYFKSKLTDQGILPVLIVVQNVSADQTFMFDKSAVGLGESSEGNGKVRSKIQASQGSGGLIDLTQVKQTSDVIQNLMKKSIQSRMLQPGVAVSGFVYVPVSISSPKNIHLQIPVTNGGSGETQVLNLQLSPGER